MEASFKHASEIWTLCRLRPSQHLRCENLEVLLFGSAGLQRSYEKRKAKRRALVCMKFVHRNDWIAHELQHTSTYHIIKITWNNMK